MFLFVSTFLTESFWLKIVLKMLVKSTVAEIKKSFADFVSIKQ